MNTDSNISRDLYAVDKALKIITQWNQAGFTEDVVIRLNVPEQWTIDQTECLVEPLIDGFFKINSNSGWTTMRNNRLTKILQALSHYSYHVSSGQFVLCDLQGGTFRDGIILTDPAILSRDARFGSTDLGPRGISTFFHCHSCNRFCQDHWTQPRDQRAYYQRRSATTMSFNHISYNKRYDSDDDDSYY